MSASPKRCSRPRSSSRDSHGGEGRIKAARFPARKTLEEFDFTFQRSVKKTVVEHLGQLDFLHARENVVLLGPPGPGSQCTSLRQGVDQSVQASGAGTLMASPLRRPRVTWIACSSPRWTLCNTVWRAQPSASAASSSETIAVGDVGHEAGADLVGEPDPPGRARAWSARRAAARRRASGGWCTRETPSSAAACWMVTSCDVGVGRRGGGDAGALAGARATRASVNGRPVPVRRPWRARIAAIWRSG